MYLLIRTTIPIIQSTRSVQRYISLDNNNEMTSTSKQKTEIYTTTLILPATEDRNEHNAEKEKTIEESTLRCPTCPGDHYLPVK